MCGSAIRAAPGSPLIDSADPARLFTAASTDALVRTRGTAPDMGALEHVPHSLIPTVSETGLIAPAGLMACAAALGLRNMSRGARMS